MKIVDARTSHYRVPREVWWPLPIGASIYDIADFEFVTCEIETDTGATGFGFTYTVGHGGSSVRSALADEVIPHIRGREAREVDALWAELHERLHFVGTGVSSVAIAAADIAIWDALARDAGVPLYRLLGAHRGAVPAYASGVNLAYTLEQLVEQVEGFRSAGFSAVKMKVGRPLEEDLERLHAVREAIGPECLLMVDANMAWDIAEAARRVRQLERFDIAWLEEPLRPADVHGHAALQAGTPIPLAAGETLFTPAEFADYLRRDAIRVVQPDVIRLGVSGWMRAARIAEAFALPLAPHFIPEIHVHLICAVPNAMCLEHLPLFERLLEEPVDIRDGIARPSERPGHGMAFAADVMDPHRVA
jgi:L-alanine-DL-glutamate epimerase-like enolase superfamily enzyme